MSSPNGTTLNGETEMTTATLTATSTRPATWIRAGVVGGAIAGMVFAMFEMVMAVVLNGGDAFFMPLRMIGAIALGTPALDPASSLVTAGGAGLVVHMALSMMYGVGVAALISAVPSLRRSLGSVVAVASAAGLGLWIVNFFLLANVFGWRWFPDGQNVIVQVVAHTMMFGSVLGLGLDRLAFRSSR